jgi:G3E family GTPase
MTCPIHIITGFLGAGKTTLMNRLLHDVPEGMRPAIVVNDFGKVVLDGELIDHGSYAVSELASGCVCCTLSGALSQALVEIVDDQAPDVILIETTGIAQPAQFPAMFTAPNLAERVHLGNIICVVDAGTFARYETHLAMLRLQVEQSNTVVLNKVDAVGPDAVTAARQRVDFLKQPDAIVVETDHCAMDTGLVYAERPIYFDAVSDPHGGHGFRSCTIEDDSVYALDALHACLQGLVGQVERGKGIVSTDRGLKCFQLTLSGVTVEDWSGDSGLSRLVFIGRDFRDIEIKDKILSCRGA